MRVLILPLVLTAALSAQEQDKKPGRLDLPTMFADHMVLQRGSKVPVWGWSEPVAEIAVSIAGKTEHTRADAKGRWRVDLPAMPPGGPHELVVSGAGNKRTVKDVLIGEVWLASGQSNMQWAVRQANDFEQEKAAANHPMIRMFTVTRTAATEPQEVCKGAWQVCTPDTVGGFSATAYFFGRDLHRKLEVPIGILHSSWGGTAIEAWTSMPVQAGRADLAGMFAPWEKQRADFLSRKAEADYKIKLANWQKRAAAARKANKRVPRRPPQPQDPVRDRNYPANLFNGMIAPLIPYGIRGAIWYQGERNARTIDSAARYRIQMELLIDDWRRRWNQGDFPFGIVQLPNFKARSDQPGVHTAWAIIRESMLQSLAIPKTGLAITIDVGEADNIHPKNKQAVGDRLARWALAQVYGQEVVASGPLVRSSRLDGTAVVFEYQHAKGGLRTSDGKPVRGFAIAGADRKWRWAEAVIDGARVRISHPDIQQPVAVRYAWADNPDCNLVNQAGLPASPFRTDDWSR